MPSNRRDVCPAGPGTWKVTQPGGGAVSTHRTQGTIEGTVKQDMTGDGGLVCVHRPNGAIRCADTVPSAKVSFPQRDTRHWLGFEGRGS